MGIKIGDNNKIKNTTIVDKMSIKGSSHSKKLNEKHPVITALLISVFAGVIMLFSFWKNIIEYIESIF